MPATPTTQPGLAGFRSSNPAKVAALRKQRRPSDAVKAQVYDGNKSGPVMAVQFHNDCNIYNVWEALLYVESYEAQGFYAKGTALKAWEAARA